MRFYWPIAKLDHERRMVYGYATTEAVDDQGEVIRREAVAAALDDYMRFANIREMHQPSAVGIAEDARLDDKGLYLAAKIVDEEAWQKVVAGVYKGFSIGGRVTARDPHDRKIITGVSLTEISVVDRPANPEAVFDCWKAASPGYRQAAHGQGEDMTEPAAGTQIPAQIWDCGTAGHRHRAKAEASRCLERRAEPDPGDDGGSLDSPLDRGDDDPIDNGPLDDAWGDPQGETAYADPGYQPDRQKRYPIDSEEHIRAAWAYIHHPANAGRYTEGQRARIKSRIVAAWQARIDPAGPPAAFAGTKAAQPGPLRKDTLRKDTLRKDLAEFGRLARILCDLAWLRRHIAVAAAQGGADPQQSERLSAGLDALVDFLERLVTAGAAELVDDEDEPGAPAELTAVAGGGGLRKAGGFDLAPLTGELAKLAGEIMPRLDALQRRVEEIAQTPLPPLTAARGIAAIAKRDDAGAGAFPDDVVAALARMSEEDRTLALIKAAHANPIRSGGWQQG